jgi:hypothetical protein
MPDVISVRQTGSSPPASFGFRLAADTLALGYVLGTINPHSGLSPARLHPCWAHIKGAVATILAATAPIRPFRPVKKNFTSKGAV